MSVRELKRFFSSHEASRADLVLATVYDTMGATYSKAGAQMLINGAGDYQGMLSGGCLEGDLAERAREVLASGDAQVVTYDLREDDDSLWGLGVGCEGLMRILLQPLRASEGYEPFATMLTMLGGEREGVALTVIESGDPELSPGATLLGTEQPLASYGVSPGGAATLEELANEALCNNRPQLETLGDGEATVTVLRAPLRPPPSILVLGGGLDAEPVVRLCADLGWRVTIQDHRPAYIEKGEFARAQAVHCLPAESVSDALAIDSFAAVVVMSHHLLTDLCYLRQLAATKVSYIGLLGPVGRRQRLMRELGDTADRLARRLHGPAGLDIGGRGPASIALSIVSQMHQLLMAARDGESSSAAGSVVIRGQ